MNFETLLQPLPSGDAAGEDLSFSTAFDTIQALRRHDDPTLSQGEWVTDLKTADWPGVAKLCQELLAQRTRDLRVVGWLTEAQAHLSGYGGLADGVALTAALCERAWDAVHPLPEDGEYDLRVGSLSWLLAQVTSLARAVPVLRAGDLQLSLQKIDAARALQKSMERSPDGVPHALPEGRITMDQVARALRETPPARLVDARDAARRLQAELLKLQTVVDGHLGADGPGFAAAKQATENALDALERMVREVGVGEASPAIASAMSETHAAATDASMAVPMVAGALTNRAQALAQLRQVADFFRRTEPHSPVAYLADKAARWGDMPLHAWLRAVLKDPGALGQLEDLLGVEPPVQNGGSY